MPLLGVGTSGRCYLVARILKISRKFVLYIKLKTTTKLISGHATVVARIQPVGPARPAPRHPSRCLCCSLACGSLHLSSSVQLGDRAAAGAWLSHSCMLSAQTSWQCCRWACGWMGSREAAESGDGPSAWASVLPGGLGLFGSGWPCVSLNLLKSKAEASLTELQNSGLDTHLTLTSHGQDWGVGEGTGAGGGHARGKVGEAPG